MNIESVAGRALPTTIPAYLAQLRAALHDAKPALSGRRLVNLRVPYADDPSANFAYFCYDGVPAWTGAVRPGITPTTNWCSRPPRLNGPER